MNTIVNINCLTLPYRYSPPLTHTHIIHSLNPSQAHSLFYFITHSFTNSFTLVTHYLNYSFDHLLKHLLYFLLETNINLRNDASQNIFAKKIKIRSF